MSITQKQLGSLEDALLIVAQLRTVRQIRARPIAQGEAVFPMKIRERTIGDLDKMRTEEYGTQVGRDIG